MAEGTKLSYWVLANGQVVYGSQASAKAINGRRCKGKGNVRAETKAQAKHRLELGPRFRRHE